VPELERSVAEARPHPGTLRHALGADDERRVVEAVLAPEGPLATRKVFCRRDVVVEVAPDLFGLEPSELPRTVDRVLADPEAVPLVATPSARERAYATATTIAREHAIAAAVDVEVVRTDAPSVPEMTARRAIARREEELGASLTVGQRAAVMGLYATNRGERPLIRAAGASCHSTPQ
jgi:hypothetical protein